MPISTGHPNARSAGSSLQFVVVPLSQAGSFRPVVAFTFLGSGLDSVIAAQEGIYRACLAAGRSDCQIQFNIGMIATPRLLASLLSVRNWQQLGQFCVVGTIGYLINLAVYDVLLRQGLHYLVAATCSFLVAVTSNYTWNRIWTFREHRGHVGIQGMRFFVV